MAVLLNNLWGRIFMVGVWLGLLYLQANPVLLNQDLSNLWLAGVYVYFSFWLEVLFLVRLVKVPSIRIVLDTTFGWYFCKYYGVNGTGWDKMGLGFIAGAVTTFFGVHKIIQDNMHNIGTADSQWYHEKIIHTRETDRLVSLDVNLQERYWENSYKYERNEITQDEYERTLLQLQRESAIEHRGHAANMNFPDKHKQGAGAYKKMNTGGLIVPQSDPGTTMPSDTAALIQKARAQNVGSTVTQTPPSLSKDE